MQFAFLKFPYPAESTLNEGIAILVQVGENAVLVPQVSIRTLGAELHHWQIA